MLSLPSFVQAWAPRRISFDRMRTRGISLFDPVGRGCTERVRQVNITITSVMAPHATTTTESKQQGYRSLPVPNPCLSYWHRTTRAFKHLNANEKTPVPQTAKYSSTTAFQRQTYSFSKPAKQSVELQVVMQDMSDQMPSAGLQHIRRSMVQNKRKKIIENEKLVFERLDSFVREHHVPCDFNSTTTFDVCLTPEFVECQKESFAAYKAAGGDVSHVQYYEGDEAKAKTGVESALAAYEWPAGSSHPAKLGQWMLEQLVERGVGLWTHCPVMEVGEHQGSRPESRAKWDVITARGIVASQVVVHCTNAYAAHLLPELSTFVTPNRAQAHSIVPGCELSGSNANASTMSLRYGLKHFFSFIQRAVDGTVVFGVSRDNPTWSKPTKSSMASFDDTNYNAEIAASSAEAYKGLFMTNGPNSARHGQGIDHSWTGIIAMTPDSVPILGALEGREGQFILAGHNGHGMARIWMCGPGLAKIIQGESWSATGLPECFQYGEARLARAATHHVRSVW
ncbi:hypothetical protein BST61_g3126 [Cercospora zeina]